MQSILSGEKKRREEGVDKTKGAETRKEGFTQKNEKKKRDWGKTLIFLRGGRVIRVETRRKPEVGKGRSQKKGELERIL